MIAKLAEAVNGKINELRPVLLVDNQGATALSASAPLNYKNKEARSAYHILITPIWV